MLIKQCQPIFTDNTIKLERQMVKKQGPDATAKQTNQPWNTLDRWDPLPRSFFLGRQWRCPEWTWLNPPHTHTHTHTQAEAQEGCKALNSSDWWSSLHCIEENSLVSPDPTSRNSFINKTGPAREQKQWLGVYKSLIRCRAVTASPELVGELLSTGGSGDRNWQ